jgi:polysaccharide export outer membrane protein
MVQFTGRPSALRFAVASIVLLGNLGCHAVRPDRAAVCSQGCRSQVPVEPSAPRELTKVILPPYRIEPPDVLQIDAVRVIPKFPYKLRLLDSLVIQVTGTLPDASIGGAYVIEPSGAINLGNPYGLVRVQGMTVEEAKQAIESQLRQTLRDPVVTVSMGEIAGKQQISGQHLVAQDGTVTLGSYGNVLVVGQTIPEAKATIENFLSSSLQDPEISVEVFAYNSKNYYIITQGAGLGDGVSKFPVTGNDTVLDAIAQINGLTSISSTKIWIARPGYGPSACDQIMPVDWIAISQRGDPATNYQLMPGDRVYVAEDKLVSTDNLLAKIISPIERVLGVTLLGSSTVFNLKNGGQNNGTGGF